MKARSFGRESINMLMALSRFLLCITHLLGHISSSISSHCYFVANLFTSVASNISITTMDQPHGLSGGDLVHEFVKLKTKDFKFPST